MNDFNSPLEKQISKHSIFALFKKVIENIHRCDKLQQSFYTVILN